MSADRERICSTVRTVWNTIAADNQRLSSYHGRLETTTQHYAHCFDGVSRIFRKQKIKVSNTTNIEIQNEPVNGYRKTENS